MKVYLGDAGVRLFSRWIEEKIDMHEAVEMARKSLPPDEYAAFLLQMGGYAFPTLLMKDLQGKETVVPVNDAIEQGIILMPGNLPFKPKM